MSVWLALGLGLYKAGFNSLSIPFFAACGMAIGFYFGNYDGRRTILNAWQNEIKHEVSQVDGILSDLKEVERERIRRQEVCSDQSHWGH